MYYDKWITPVDATVQIVGDIAVVRKSKTNWLLNYMSGKEPGPCNGNTLT